MFVPPVYGEAPENEFLIKTKHSLDLSITSVDLKGKSLFQVNDDKTVPFSFYNRVCHLDLDYLTESHREGESFGRVFKQTFRQANYFQSSKLESPDSWCTEL